jgi:hypothetical protein
MFCIYSCKFVIFFINKETNLRTMEDTPDFPQLSELYQYPAAVRAIPIVSDYVKPISQCRRRWACI